MVNSAEPLVMALPKGRMLDEIAPILQRAGIVPEPAFADPDARQLTFKSLDRPLTIVRVRAFDVATFVAFGAAQLGICGSDVSGEFDYPEVYAPADLRVARCRLVVAAPRSFTETDPNRWSHVRVATKYPQLTQRHFAASGVQAECIKLHGAIELAPMLGLCRRIVDLTQTGETLRANGLVEIETIMECTARLLVSRVATKTRARAIGEWTERLRAAVRETQDGP